MKPKAILSLVIAFAVLAALVMIKRSGDTQTSLVEQVELTPLVPEDIDIDTVERLEIYAGAKSSERVVLTRDGDQWRVASLYDARAVKGRAQQVLDAVAGLQGEFRATVTGDALVDYDLTDDRAFHVMGFTSDRTEVFHVLTGKSPKYGDMFMRPADSESVYIVNKNIRRDAFLYSLDYDDPPKSEPWLDKQIVGIQGDDFVKVELTMSDKTLVAEKRPIAKEETESEEADASKEDASGEEASAEETSVEITEEETEWVVTEGGFEGDVHQTPFRDLERYAANLSGFTVVSPEKEEIWGLDEPNNHLILHRENGEIIDLEVSHPSTNGPAYVRRLDNDDKTMYSIELNKFQALFAAGGAYYDLPGLLLEEDEMKTVEYTTPDGTMQFAKEATGWKLNSPQVDLPINNFAFATLERILSSWQAMDYADAGVDSGLSDAEYSVTFTTAEKSHQIVVGVKSTHVIGRYAKLDGGSDILVMSEADFAKVFLSPAKLFDSNIVPVDDDDEIVHVSMTKGDTEVVFQLGDLDWEATSGDESFDPNQTAMDEFLTALTDAKADDVKIEGWGPAESIGSLLIKSDKGSEWTLSIALTEENTYSVSQNGSTSTYTISEDQMNKLLPTLESFKVSNSDEEITFKQPVLNSAPAHDPNDGHQH